MLVRHKVTRSLFTVPENNSPDHAQGHLYVPVHNFWKKKGDIFSKKPAKPRQRKKIIKMRIDSCTAWDK
jgi:hypothetical protein